MTLPTSYPESGNTDLADQIHVLHTLVAQLPPRQESITPAYQAYVAQIQQIAVEGEVWDLRFAEAGQVFAWASAVLQHQGELAEAENLLRRALVIWEGLPEAPGQALDVVRYNVGLLAQQQKHYTEAASLIQQAITRRSASFPVSDLTTILYLMTLGTVYEQQERFAEAELIYTKALDYCQQKAVPEDEQTNLLRYKLAQLYIKQDNPQSVHLTTAKKLLGKAIAYYIQSKGSDHLATATVQHKLAQAYMAQQEWDQAEALFQHVRVVYARDMSPDHPEYADMLYLLAYTRAIRQQWDVFTLDLLQQVAQLDAQRLGPDNPRTLEINANLAVVYASQEKPELAEPLLRNVQKMYTQTLGVDHQATGQTYLALAGLYLAQEHWTQAAQEIARAMQIFAVAPAETRLLALQGYQGLLLVASQQDDETEATRLLKHIYELLEELAEDADGVERVVGLNGLAQFALQEGQYNRAERLLLRTLDICKDHQEIGYLTLAVILQNLGLAYFGQGKQAFAEEMMRRVEDLKEILGTPLTGLRA